MCLYSANCGEYLANEIHLSGSVALASIFLDGDYVVVALLIVVDPYVFCSVVFRPLF